MTHICVGKLTISGSDNSLSPGRRQAIIWTNAGILLIGPLGTNFSEIFSEIQLFSFKKMHLKMSSVKWRPFYCGLNVLTVTIWSPQFLWSDPGGMRKCKNNIWSKKTICLQQNTRRAKRLRFCDINCTYLSMRHVSVSNQSKIVKTHDETSVISKVNIYYWGIVGIIQSLVCDQMWTIHLALSLFECYMCMYV